MMLARMLTACLMLTFANGCASTPGSDAAICDGTQASRQTLAAALVEDGGPQSQRAGLQVLNQLAAGCH